jgi:polysaccharide pyruvyl transferase WcaK-like protein
VKARAARGAHPRLSEQHGKRLLLLSGGVGSPEGSINLGDVAQLEAVVQRLRYLDEPPEIVLCPNSLRERLPEHLRGYLSLDEQIRRELIPSRRRGISRLAAAAALPGGRWPRWLRSVTEELERYSGLLATGAGLFVDAYVMGVGIFWGVLFHLARRLGIPTAATGQQIGPLLHPHTRLVTRWALRKLRILGVRDPLSLTDARRLLGGRPLSVLSGDDAWDLVPDRPAAAKIRRNLGVGDRYIVWQVRFGTVAGVPLDYAEELARALDGLAETWEAELVCVPLFVGAPRDDLWAARQVIRRLRTPSAILSDERRPAVVKALIADAVLALGCANHFAVFAASSGIPTVALFATPYMRRKLEGLAAIAPRLVAPRPAGTSVREILSAAWLVAQARGALPELERQDVVGMFLRDAGFML